jgi:hypothetical protein
VVVLKILPSYHQVPEMNEIIRDRFIALHENGGKRSSPGMAPPFSTEDDRNASTIRV